MKYLIAVLTLLVACNQPTNEVYNRSVTATGQDHIVSLYAVCDDGSIAIDGDCRGGIVIRDRLERQLWQYCAWSGPKGAELTARVWCER